MRIAFGILARSPRTAPSFDQPLQLLGAALQSLTSELLFASNLDLGALVLDHFQDSVSVVAEGAPGAKVDIVYFRFENGQVVTFSQLHYAPRH